MSRKRARKTHETHGYTAAQHRRYRERSLWTVTEFSRAFRMAPDTVNKAVRANRLEPHQVNGTARFDIAQLVDACFMRDAGGALDPSKLDPYRLRSFREAQLAAVKLQRLAGQLVTLDAHVDEVARVLKLTARLCDALPGICEQNGAPPIAVQAIEHAVGSWRNEIADELAAPDKDAGK